VPETWQFGPAACLEAKDVAFCHVSVHICSPPMNILSRKFGLKLVTAEAVLAAARFIHARRHFSKGFPGRG